MFLPLLHKLNITQCFAFYFHYFLHVMPTYVILYSFPIKYGPILYYTNIIPTAVPPYCVRGNSIDRSHNKGITCTVRERERERYSVQHAVHACDSQNIIRYRPVVQYNTV